MTTPAVLDALTSFLALGDAPDDGAALFDAYAPGAMLYYDGTVAPLGELDRDSFVATWRFTQGLFGRRPRPVFLNPALHRVEEESADRIVAWFTATEREHGHAVYLAGGFERHDGAWRIDWLLLDKAPQPLTFASGRMQMLGDFAFGQGAGLIFPSSWLEVGYFRHFDLPRPPLLLQEGARFGCQSQAGCCSANFGIEVPAAAQHAVDAIPWETLHPPLVGTRLELLESGDRLLKKNGEVCRFLDEKNHCRIHAALGRAIFPVCARYPFVMTQTPDGLAVASSYACGTVRGNIGPLLTERADDLYERAAMGPSGGLPTYFSLAAGNAVEWDEYAEAQETIMGILDQAELPLHRRLWMVGRMILAWCTDEPASLPMLQAEVLPISEGPMRTLQHSMVRYFCGGFDDSALHEPRALSHDLPIAPEAAVVGMIQNVFHSQALSFQLSMAASFNVGVAIYLQALQATAANPGQPLSGALLREISIQMQHGRFLAYLAKLAEQGIDMRDLLGDPTFGLGLLAYPTPHGAAAEPVEA
ncbi:MAG: hypothetical protein ACK46X_17530 [Candidatus Sericytochromatia bacterium]